MNPLSAPLDADARVARRPVLVVSHGTENIYERGFCNGLSDAGIGFTLVSSDQTDYAGLRPATSTLNLRGSQLRHRPRWQKLLNILRYQIVLMAHVAKSRPHLVHVIGLVEPPLLRGMLDALWYRLWARRYALTVHDTERHDHGSALNRRLYTLAFRLATHLVVHTRASRDDLVTRCGIAPGRVFVMEHGIEPLNTPPSLPAPGRLPRPLRLLAFGKVMRYKGLDLLLDALRDFSHPFELIIAGQSLDVDLTSELRAQIASHPQAASIRWDDAYVAESAIPALFEDADVQVLAYRRIDQSGVLFQALRFGLPVVASRAGSLERYVSPEVGECFDAGSSADLRAALLRLLDRYPAIDRTAIRAVGLRYEWRHTVEPLASIYGTTR